MTEQTKVYQYGLLPPTPETTKLVDDTLFQAHQFYNNLIAIYREQRQVVWDLDNDALKALNTQIGNLYKELGETEGDINELRATLPKGDEAKLLHQEKIDALKAKGKEIEASIKALKEEAKVLRAKQWKNPEHKAKVKETLVPYKTRLKETRKTSGLPWGTYNHVFASAEQAYKTTSGLPRFQRYKGEGTLAIQLQKQGEDTSKQEPSLVFGTEHTFVQIDPVDPRAWDRTPFDRAALTKGQRKKFQRTKLRLRLASDGRKPIFAEFPMILHRPLPEGALITVVTVTRRKQANKYKYTVQMSIKTPAPEPVSVSDVKSAIAIDLGWRSQDGGLRVAYWVNSKGQHDSFNLPASYRDRLNKAQSIRGIRDKLFDRVRGRLAEDIKRTRQQQSPELQEASKTLIRWKSQSRLARLWFRFKDELLPLLTDIGEDEDFRSDPHLSKYGNYLEAWFHRDRHLWQYESGMRCEALHYRNDLYANWAAELVQKYDLIVLEKFRVSNLSRKAKPSKKADLPDNVAARNNGANKQRVEAAVATLRGIIINAARGAGKLVIKVPAQNTSKICANCGGKCKITHKKTHTCEHCGVSFDRDHNAGKNILTKSRALLDHPTKLQEASLIPVPKPPRWSRRKKAGF